MLGIYGFQALLFCLRDDTESLVRQAYRFALILPNAHWRITFFSFLSIISDPKAMEDNNVSLCHGERPGNSFD